jgi:hypothetical protein
MVEKIVSKPGKKQEKNRKKLCGQGECGKVMIDGRVVGGI